MKSNSNPDPSTERKLLGISTTKGEMLLELYPDAAPNLVAAFSQHCEAAYGREMIVASAVTWFMSDKYEDTNPPRQLLPVEANDLPYKRGSLVLPLNSKGQVNVASFAILNHEVSSTDDSYAYYRKPDYTYPGYVVIGQLVSGWELISGVSSTFTINQIKLLRESELPARLANIPPTPPMRTDFEATHLFSMTITNRDKHVVLSGELYGKDAPEGVALFLKEYQRYMGATVAARDTSISISDLNGSVFRPMLAGTTLPLRRGSLVWGSNDGTDVSTIYLNKYDDGTLGTGVIGQLTSDLDVLSKIGKERIGGIIFMGDDGSDYDKVRQVEVQELSPVPLLTSVEVDPAEKGLNSVLIETSRGFIDCPFYFAAIQPTKGFHAPYFLEPRLKFEPGRVTIGSGSIIGLRVPIGIRRNNLPYKRGSILMRRSPSLYRTDNIVILTADLATGDPEYVVVGEVAGGMDREGNKADGMGIVEQLTDSDEAMFLFFFSADKLPAYHRTSSKSGLSAARRPTFARSYHCPAILTRTMSEV